MSRVPRTEEGRVGAVANGGTINGTYALPPGEALEAFRADLRVLCGRPTEDSYMAACRALHWRVAELRAHGIEPIRIPMDAPHYPPEGYSFPAPQAQPLAAWHEDMGDVLWWRFPVDEAPWVGSPLDCAWPGYHTHFTPLPAVPEPQMPASVDLGFVDRSEGGPGRTSIKKSHRVEGRNFVD